jgi:hypothetical protein
MGLQDEQTPLLEQRRVVGSLRERTIFVPTPSPVPNRHETLVNERLERLSSRLMQYIEQSLSQCEASIEEEINQIDKENEEAQLYARERPNQRFHDRKWDPRTPQIVSRRLNVHTPVECQRPLKAVTYAPRGGWSHWTASDSKVP